MSRKARAWVGGIGAFLFFILVAWLVHWILGAEGRTAWILWISMVVLGLGAAGLLARLLWVTGPMPESDEPDDEALALEAAQDRLARSSAPHSRLSRLPLTLVLGPRGSTKTTLMTRTGLDPELLAGEVFQGETVVETEGINLWYRDGTVYLEAGGGLLEDEERWKRLLRRIRPSSWGAAFGRGRQAPRAVVLCYGADEFLKPGAGEAVPAQARELRKRLAQLSAELGISVPVYVVFTRCDRFPFFLDYVRSLTPGEVVEPLGTTLPLRSDTDPGSHSREEGQRIREAFEELQVSLSTNRLRVLPREGDPAVRAGAYEFPRELRKVSELATSFLVELCRPSQLAVSPVLRGFYFTGVRPVVVRDAEASAPTPDPVGGGGGDVGATGVFNAQQIQAQARQAQASSGGSTRKVPQWVFLDQLLRSLLPGDTNAQALTAGGARVDLLRRLGLTLLAVAALVTIVGTTWSFLGNRSLESRVVAAAESVTALNPEPGVPPSAGDLESLEELRSELAVLRDYAEARPPWRLRWGLYQGDALLETTRPLYFDRFDALLWSSIRDRLVDRLDGLEGEPGEDDDYSETYDALRAYLVTTRHPDRSEPDIVTPALMAHWVYAGEVDEERRDLARAQIDFFATEMAVDHPLPRSADDGRVARTREFLFQFAEEDRVYQALLSDGSAGIETVELARIAPGAGGSVRSDASVPGAFTEEGWERVQAALDDVDRLFAAEQWVVGEQAISEEDRERLTAQLRNRYVEDYVTHWQRFLETASVAGFGSVAGAARNLDILSGNQSPILQVLAVTARNTMVDSVQVAPAFQPVHQTTPPEIRDRFISEANEEYMAGLVDLHASMEQLADASGGGREQAMGAVTSSAEQTRRAVRQLAQNFSVAGEAQPVASAVQRLMEAPVSHAESLVTRLPAAQVNARGESLCASFNPVLARYPFDRNASQEVQMDDLESLFGPEEGTLWVFYDDVGQALLSREGGRYVAAPDASPQPTPEFVSFFNRASEVSRAFFGEQGQGPEVVFALRPQTSPELPEVSVSMDGQSHRFTRTVAAAHTFVWEGDRAQNLQITGQVAGQEVTLLEAPEGPWALFRLFGQAQWEQVGQGRYELTWSIPGEQMNLTMELSLARGIPVFRGGFIADLNCVSRIAR